ncbi:MAG: isochorismatase family protein [Planctomycetota bacterium]
MERLILIIDPQVAFCDATGSLAKTFGVSELAAISERLRDLETFLGSYPNRNELCVIRSEYQPGQFTGGDLRHPYSQACVPGPSEDCDLSLPQSVLTGVRVFTKHEESAASVFELTEMLRVEGPKDVLLAGFLTTSCVRKTALSFRSVLPQSVTVGVLEDLTASRASNYRSVAGGVSRHDAVLDEMQRSGVTLVQSTSMGVPGDNQFE